MQSLPVTRYCQFLPFLAPIWLKASCHWKTVVCAQRLTKIKSFQKTRWWRKKRSERKGVHWSGVEEVNFRPHWISNLPNHNISNRKANKMDPGGWKWKCKSKSSRRDEWLLLQNSWDGLLLAILCTNIGLIWFDD